MRRKDWRVAGLSSAAVFVGLSMACGAPSSSSNPTASGPTPNIEATIQSRVQATVEAAPQKAAAVQAPAQSTSSQQASSQQTAPAQPTAAPVAAEPTTPPAPTAAPPSPTPVLSRKSIWVANTDGEGVNVRNTPNSSDRSDHGYKDGTPLTQLGDPISAGGATWLRVTGSDGFDGFIPAQYTATTPPPTPVPPTPKPTPMPAIGSEAQNGEWAIKFVQEVRMPSLGSAYSPKRAQGEFLVLDLILTNQGKRTMSLNDWDFTVHRGEIKYSTSSDGTFALVGGNSAYEPLTFGATVQPGLSKKTRLVFDVPPGATGLVLEAASMRFAVPDAKKAP
jgi:Domain of unknown function (DUF4352)